MQSIHFYLLLLTHLFLLNLTAQPGTQKLTKATLPSGIQYKGKLISALRWKDNAGNNVLVLSETGDYQSATDLADGNRTAELYANHYLLNGDSTALNWKLLDFERACPVDVLAEFLVKGHHEDHLIRRKKETCYEGHPEDQDKSNNLSGRRV